MGSGASDHDDEVAPHQDVVVRQGLWLLAGARELFRRRRRVRQQPSVPPPALEQGGLELREGGSVRVSTNVYDHGKRFRLIVTDGGPGVSDEEFAGLTANKRFRGDEARSRRPGSRGLGLALAREIADRFGLQLDIRRPMKGGLEVEFTTRVSI